MSKYDINNLNEVYELLQKDNVDLNKKYSYNKKNKSHTMTLGRIWFNCLLPDDYPIINEPIDKKKLYSVIDDIYEKYSVEKAAEIVSKINRESFKMTSINPATFDINSVIVPESVREKKSKELSPDVPFEEFGIKLEKLSNEYIEDMDDEAGIKDILKSGARGKPVDYGVLQLAKGPVLTIESQVTKPITSSLTDGYNPEEYYDAASGSRRAYYIRSRGTAEPGTLARGTTYANSNTKINKDDCNTKKYFELEVTKSIAKTITHRYYLNERTNKIEMIKDPEKLVGKTIKLRSPLYCKDKKGICKICYGELYSKLNTKYIGLLAGEVINDAGQSFTMSQRHKSTSFSIKEVDFTKDIITT